MIGLIIFTRVFVFELPIRRQPGKTARQNAPRTILLAIEIADHARQGFGIVLVDCRIEVGTDIDHGISSIAKNDEQQGHDGQ